MALNTQDIQTTLADAGIDSEDFAAWLTENNLKVAADTLRDTATDLRADGDLEKSLNALPGSVSQEIAETWLHKRANSIHERKNVEFYPVDATFPDDGYYMTRLAEGAYQVRWFDEVEGYDTPLPEVFTTRADALRAMFVDWKRTGNLGGADLTGIKNALREAVTKGE